MYTNPHIGGGQQRDSLARAEKQRRAQRFRPRSRTVRPAECTERYLHWFTRTMARLRTVIPHPARRITDAEAAEGSRPYEA